MSIFEKIKFLSQLNNMVKEIQMLAKLKAGMAKMDGMKSVIGLLMVVAYYALPNYGVHVPDMVLKMGSAWAAVGLAHKLDKTTGILTMVVQVLTATKDSVNKGA